MAHRARLIAWLLAGVLLGHLAALDWVAGRLHSPAALKPMAPAMHTRLLAPAVPAEPPPVAPAPAATAPAPSKPGAVAAALRPAAAASGPHRDRPARPPRRPPPVVPEPAPVAPASAVAPEPEPEPGSATATVPVDAAEAPAAAAEAAAPPAGPSTSASAPEAGAAGPSGPPSLATWPTDTRLEYRLGGRFRSGELYGKAHVDWQREGSRYQVRVDVDVTLLASLVMTSQGEVGPDGLRPQAYEELRPGGRRRFAQFGETDLFLEQGRTLPRPPGLQDTASQFVELAHRFATGRAPLAVGHSVSFWMARPGAVDRWTYDVVAQEILQLGDLGPVEAFHLQPRPIANPRGNITAEMWFAPSLQYLPVRIRVVMGEEAHVDLLVKRIRQR